MEEGNAKTGLLHCIKKSRILATGNANPMQISGEDVET